MALQTFGVTHQKVKAHHFPQLQGDFSASSNPSSATVTEMVEAEAARLDGKLRQKDVDPATAATLDGGNPKYPAAYNWCADTIRLGAAVRVIRAMAGQDPAVAKAWEEELRERYSDLDKWGHATLGDIPAPAQQSMGPRSHLKANSLDTGDETLISDAIPAFRRDDEL